MSYVDLFISSFIIYTFANGILSFPSFSVSITPYLIQSLVQGRTQHIKCKHGFDVPYFVVAPQGCSNGIKAILSYDCPNTSAVIAKDIYEIEEYHNK